MEYSILVVDDQPDNIKFISLLLKEMGLGKKIYSAPNGKIASELVKKVSPNLILSDWEMPEMDGLELLKSLKLSEETKDIPFIMISAVKVDAESMKESFDVGVHDYLKKPFDKLEFMARVNATLKLQDAYLKIKKSKEEIADQALLISKQHEELKRLNELKDKIFSIISHDVRTPLATLDGLLHLFNDEEIEMGPKELVRYTNLVQNELHSIQSLMDNLLDWVKSQLLEKQAVKSSVNIYEIVQEIFDLYNERIKIKNINFYNNIDFDEIVYGDKDIISFVSRNLCANAIKFTKKGGDVIVESETSDDTIKISVIDTGVGMDDETLESLFDKQNVSSQRGTSGELGTGLGLRLCKELVEQNDGTISVESELGKGSTFSFVLPVQKE